LTSQITNESVEICNYVIKPLNLVVNLLYYIANYVCYDSNVNKDEQPIFNNATKPSKLKGLDVYFNNLMSVFSQSGIIDAIYNVRTEKTTTNRQIEKTITDNITKSNPIFGDIYNLIRDINTFNAGIGINLDSSLPVNATQLEFYNILKNIMDLHEDKIHSELTTTEKEISYYTYTYKSLAHMVNIDKNIADTIRNFQTNDKCDRPASNNSTKLEYELKYKPNILGMPMGSLKTNVNPHIYRPNNEHCNTRMLYCFLDVLDTYKKNPTAYQDKLAEIKRHCDAAFAGRAGADTYPAFFHKMLYDAAPDINYIRNTFTTELDKLINNEDTNRYILYGYRKYGNSDILAQPDGGLQPKIQQFSTKFNSVNIYDKNLYAIMKRLTGLHRSNEYRYATANMRQHNTQEETFKPENVFNIDYFRLNRVSAQENLKIDIEIIRKFFLEVIYQNAFIESDKNERIDLIINIIFEVIINNLFLITLKFFCAIFAEIY
jgi:hypothetical protein